MCGSRHAFSQQDLDLKPTQQMADNAARGLELREKHGKGGTSVGVARARDIKNRANLSPETVKRMHSFFSRHQGNQAGGEDDAGYIAWMLWGGDAGKAWSARKAAQIDKNESARRAANMNVKSKTTFAADLVVHKFPDGWLVVERHSGFSGQKELVLTKAGQQGLIVGSISEAKTKHDALTNWVFRAQVVEKRPNEWVIQSTTQDGGYSLGGRGGQPFTSKVKAEEALRKMQESYRKKAGMKRERNTFANPAARKSTMALNPVITDALKFHTAKMSDLLRQFISEAKRVHATYADLGWAGRGFDSSWISEQRGIVDNAISAMARGNVVGASNIVRQWADEFFGTYGHHEHSRTLAFLARAIAREPSHVVELAKAHKVTLSRSARKATMARELIGSKGNKRVYLGGPDGSGKYNVYFVQVASTGVPGETPAEDLIELKQFATEAKARSAAQKMLSSRPGAKAAMGDQDPAKELLRVRIGSSTVSAKDFMDYAKQYVPGVSRSDFLADVIEKVNAALQRRGESIRATMLVRGKDFSRPGAKARFNAASAWLAKYLSKVNEWWRDHTDYPTDLDASSDRGDIEGVLDDIAEHCREAVPREARPSWYAAAVRDMQKIPHARKAHMKNHFGIDRPMNVSQTASGGGTWTTKTERYGSKKATVEFYNKGGMVGSVYQDPDNPRLYKAFSEPDGREIASGSRDACKAAVEKLAMSRPGKATMAKFKVGDRIAYKPFPADTAGEIVEIREPDFVGDIQRRRSGQRLEVEYGVRQAGGAIMWIDEGMAVKASRPGAKAVFEIKVGDRVLGSLAVQGGAGVIGTVFKIEDGYAHIHGDPSVDDERWGRKTYKVPLRLVTKMSRPGAKARFGGMRNMTNGPYTLHYTASGLYGEPTWRLIDKNGKPTNAVEHDEANAREMLRKANAGEAVYISSRPGAKAAMSRPGEAEAFAIGATSDSADPAKDEALTALAAKVGREHTVNLFKRWSEGKASMNRSEGN